VSFAGVLSKPRVTGDPAVVSAEAVRFEEVAATISAAADSLRRLDAGTTSSDAVDAFLLKAADLESRLRTAHGRYAETGSALHGYATALSEAQASAGPALRSYDAEVERRDAAASLEVRFEQMAMIATDDESTEWYRQQARAQASRRDDAAVMVARHGASVDAAHESVEAAARTAIARIDTATDDGLRDTVWDDVSVAVGDGYDAFQAWMEENDAWISTVLDVATVIGIALAFASVLFPLTCWIGPLVFAVMAASIVAQGARAVAGTGSYVDLAVSLASVATFGVGGAVLQAAVRSSVAKVALARVGELSRAGVPVRTAFKGVTGEFDAAMRGSVDLVSRLRGMGNGELARVAQWATYSSAGASAAAQGVVKELNRNMMAAASFRLGSIVLDSGRVLYSRKDPHGSEGSYSGAPG